MRSLSREHDARPCDFHLGEEEYEVRYEPGLSDSRIFGGNSKWRGSLWFPVELLHSDTARGLGASHQSGWTALVAPLLPFGGALDFDDRREARFPTLRPPPVEVARTGPE